MIMDPDDTKVVDSQLHRSSAKSPPTIWWTLFDLVLLYPFLAANVCVAAATYEHLSPWSGCAFALIQIGVCLAFPVGIYLMWRYDLRGQYKKERIAAKVPLAALLFVTFLELPLSHFFQWLDELVIAG